jgi:hypothetical protein
LRQGRQLPRLRDDERKAIPLERYLVRPARLPGESLVGWTHRFYGENGWDVHPQVLRQLKTAYRRIYGSDKRQQALDFLRTFLGPMSRLDPATWATKWLLAESDVASRWLSEWTVREVSRMHFCPECLRRWSFHQELWELPGIRACPMHSTFLRDGCPQCGASLSAEHFRNGFICRCGQFLADGHGLRTRSAWVDFSRSVVAANPEVVPAGYSRSEGGRLRTHDLYLLLTVLARTRYKAINLYRKKQGLSQNLHCSLTPTLRDMRFLGSWPNNARRFLIGMVRTRTDESTALRWLEGDSLVDHLLLLGRELAPYRNTSVYQEVHRLISQYVPVVFQGKALLVNPRLNPTGASEIPQDLLGWWSELTSARGVRQLLGKSGRSLQA